MDDLKKHIAKLREDFMRGTLDESEVSKNPFDQFELWLKQAVETGVAEAQAMTLSTVSQDGKPSSRIVYLREFENNCFWFYGNYQSRKGKQLAANPHACLNFFWPLLERQVRIEGLVSICPDVDSDAYYNQRPLDSKIGAWASAQSSVLSSRNELEEKVERFKKQFENMPVERPQFWGGWILQANYYEFWQGRKSRLHDRVCYKQENNNWKILRIAP